MKYIVLFQLECHVGIFSREFDTYEAATDFAKQEHLISYNEEFDEEDKTLKFENIIIHGEVMGYQR